MTQPIITLCVYRQIQNTQLSELELMNDYHKQ